MSAEKQIVKISEAWNKLVQRYQDDDVDFMSQNMLKDMRHLCEAVICLVCFPQESDFNYNLIRVSLSAIRKVKDKRFLLEFHECVQNSVSHYCIDENNSPFLLYRYLPYVLRIKRMLREEYGIDCFSCISTNLLRYDRELEEYYYNIAQVIYSTEEAKGEQEVSQTMYLHSQKTIYVRGMLMYEITLLPAGIHLSKAEGIIVYSKHNVHTRYGIRVSLVRREVSQAQMKMPISLLIGYEMYIQPAELNTFAKILGFDMRVSRRNIEYKNLMSILQRSRYRLNDILGGEDNLFVRFEEKLQAGVTSVRLLPVFKKAREILSLKKPGVNVLAYLLCTFNYVIMQEQLGIEPLSYMSGLYLKSKCYAFEKMPFCTGLSNHNTRIEDVISSVNAEEREHELLARKIEHNTEKNGELFMDVSELLKYKTLEEIEGLINKFNSSLCLQHSHREIKWHNKEFLYVKGYADKTAYILETLCNQVRESVKNYETWASQQIQLNLVVDCDEKSQILQKLFSQSGVAIITGPAGTGKSTMMKHIAELFKGFKMRFIASTNPAVDNLKRRVAAYDEQCSTISKYLHMSNKQKECELLFIDECSAVSNEDMYQILRCNQENNNHNFRLLILTGDALQLESISFGNWFTLIPHFISDSALFNLTQMHRSKDVGLLRFWQSVREISANTQEEMAKQSISSPVDMSLLESEFEDAIILTPNYGGPLGINNLNLFLQNNNKNDSVAWGHRRYKIGDPVLFNDNHDFAPIVHNNSKGRIYDIKVFDDEIIFEIELDYHINPMEADRLGISTVDCDDMDIKGTVIQISVKNQRNDDSVEVEEASLPFNIAYAVSIHKAQGLEYDHVRVVITDDVQDIITHNVFYTAVTRARKKLKVYWNPEIADTIMKSMTKNNKHREAGIIAHLYGLKFLR